MVTNLAEFVLLSWPPIVVAIFAVLGPRRGAVTAAVAGWLFLPNIGYVLPGFLDYSKTTATILGTLLAVAIFDVNRLISFRPRWTDLPVALGWFGVLLTGYSNSLGAYTTATQLLGYAIAWVVPFLTGRLYLADAGGARMMAMGLTLGGLAYAPLCLWEIRMSPQLRTWLYGVPTPYDLPRFGLWYRPVVFLATPLETGMWMTAAALAAVWLWYTRAERSVVGLPLKTVSVFLVVVAVLCKSVGAAILLFFGLTTLWLASKTKWRSPLWALALLPFLYVGLRSSGEWSGDQLVEVARRVVNEERASSLKYRLNCEDKLLQKALQRPLLGWGGGEQSLVYDAQGRMVVTDGFWIITLGAGGFVGLVAITCIFEIPVARLIRRLPPRDWAGAENGPAAAMACLLGLHMIDNLFNAMYNPVYIVIAGGLSAYAVATPGRLREQVRAALTEADGLRASGDIEGAEHVCRVVIAACEPSQRSGPGSPPMRAAGHQVLAAVLRDSGRDDEAEEALRAAVRSWGECAGSTPEGVDGLADALEDAARLMKAKCRGGEAVALWREVLALREHAAAADPEGEAGGRLAAAQNDFAWLLVFGPEPDHRDPEAAVRLAEGAVALRPALACYWNTLGAACYYAIDFTGAVGALTRAVELDGAGTAFDHYLLALAFARLGDRDAAEGWFARAERAEPAPALSPELAAVRDEAVAVCSSLANRP